MPDTPLSHLLDGPGSDRSPGPSEPSDDRRGDAEELDDLGGLDDLMEPRRLPRTTRVLLASVAVALSFTGGALVQRHLGGSSGGATGFPPGGLPSGFPAGGSVPLLSGSGPGTGSSSGSATPPPALIGTVVRVEGRRVVVEDLGGDRHVVRTDSTTTVSITSTASVASLRAGQQVRIGGERSDDGSVDASSISSR